MLLTVLYVVSLDAQTAEKMFIAMPEPILPVLDAAKRLELTENYKAGLKAEIKTQLEDTCVLLRMTDEYLQVRNSNSNWEMILLPLVNDSKVICLIRTVCIPVCDSKLEFYTTNWKKLDADLFFTFADKIYFLKDDINLDDNEIRNDLIPLDISLMELRYDPDKQELLQYYNTPRYLSSDEQEKVKRYLKEIPAVFKWNKSRFEIIGENRQIKVFN
jgi:hypothetical protein